MDLAASRERGEPVLQLVRLGGAWSDPSYLFMNSDPEPPFDRSSAYGFRCVKYTEPLPPLLAGEIERPTRDYAKEEPASDDVFNVYKSL